MALPMNAGQGTPNLAAIKPVGTVAPVAPQGQQAYQIPITQTLPLGDGSGNTATVIVQTITVTAQQLTQGIAQANQQIANAQKQVADLQSKLDAITALSAAQVAPATPVKA